MSSPENAVEVPAPRISVVMAVYNGEKFLKDAIDSILCQSFTDFEFIIIDDGSREGTATVIKDYVQKDRRIRAIRHNNKGLTKSLNIGISLARGKIIARQDADDISLPHRFEKQIQFLDSNTGVIALGGCSEDLFEDGERSTWRYLDDREIKAAVFLRTPFPHSTAMIRKDVLLKVGGYDETFLTAQDMELWMRLSKTGKISMIPDIILQRRVNSDSISLKRRNRQFYDSLRARLKHGKNPILALFHGLRTFVISFVPAHVIRQIKGGRA